MLLPLGPMRYDVYGRASGLVRQSHRVGIDAAAAAAAAQNDQDCNQDVRPHFSAFSVEAAALERLPRYVSRSRSFVTSRS